MGFLTYVVLDLTSELTHFGTDVLVFQVGGNASSVILLGPPDTTKS